MMLYNSLPFSLVVLTQFCKHETMKWLLLGWKNTVSTRVKPRTQTSKTTWLAACVSCEVRKLKCIYCREIFSGNKHCLPSTAQNRTRNIRRRHSMKQPEHEGVKEGVQGHSLFALQSHDSDHHHTVTLKQIMGFQSKCLLVHLSQPFKWLSMEGYIRIAALDTKSQAAKAPSYSANTLCQGA